VRTHVEQTKFELEKTKKKADSNKRSVIIFPILYIIGLGIILASADQSHNDGMIFLGIIFMGIPSISAGIAWGKDSAKEGKKDGCLVQAFAFLIAPIVLFALGIIVTPIVILSRLIKISTNKRKIEQLQKSYNEGEEQMMSDQELETFIDQL